MFISAKLVQSVVFLGAIYNRIYDLFKSAIASMNIDFSLKGIYKHSRSNTLDRDLWQKNGKAKE